ncbi:hypothetical protein DFQ29_009980 [Apophysomyces sp. BC1021]|nr:hypothetical protein DFQ29_009980 [Apophysomyces sp. BC1021]
MAEIPTNPMLMGQNSSKGKQMKTNVILKTKQENCVVLSSDKDLQALLISHDIAIPTPVRPWTVRDIELLNTPLGQSFEADLLTSPEIIPDFKILTLQQRVFKALFQYFDPILAEDKVHVASNPTYKKAWSLYEQLEETLYPWLHLHWKNAFQINKRTSGKGIVICIGNSQFQHAATTIRAIREVLKSDLPIEVFYIRDDDLSPQKREYLETEFKNLTTKQIDHIIDDWYTRFTGWSLKPYAILASSFTEVLLMDADTFWIGYEMVQTPYAFIRSFGAVIGGLGDAGDPSTVCGNQLHLDVDQEPLWWNGGLLRDKNRWPTRYLTFTHYATGEDWEFKSSCIKETDGIRELNTNEKRLASEYLELDRQRRVDEELIDQNKWKAA